MTILHLIKQYCFPFSLFSIADVSQSVLSNAKTIVKITENGDIRWSFRMLTRTNCDLEFQNFPYDEQNCTLKFVSWSYDNASLFLNTVHKSEKSIPSTSWKTTKTEGSLVYQSFEGHDHPFSYGYVNVHMRRIETPLTLGLVVPSALLSALVLLSFVLPIGGGERISLCLTILLTVTLFQQLSSELIPSSQLPYLSQYFFILLIVQIFALIANAIVIHLHFENQRHIPSFIRKIFLHDDGSASTKFRKSKSKIQSSPAASNGTEILDNNNVIIENKKTDGRCSRFELDNAPHSGMSSTSNTRQSDKEDETLNLAGIDDQLVSDWEVICKLLDRFFFVLFMVVFMAALIWNLHAHGLQS